MISGTITQILTQKENDWGRYRLDLNPGSIIAVGVIPGASLHMSVVLEGDEERSSYGKQYKIKSVLRTEREENAGIRKFLTDGYIKGIGEKTADYLVDTYGKDVFKLFEENNGKALLEIKGISEDKLVTILDTYNDNKKYLDIVTALNGMVTMNQAQKIYDKYKEKSAMLLKKNPYVLQTELSGFGFLKTDAIAMAAGVKPDSIYRVGAAVRYLLDDAALKEGHCFLYMADIKDKVKDLLVKMPKFEDVGERAVANATADWYSNKEKFMKAHKPSMATLDKIEEVIETRKLIEKALSEAMTKAVEDKVLVNDDGRIYTQPMYEKECACAEMLVKMLNTNPVRFIKPEVVEKAIHMVEERKSKAMGFTFEATNEQRDAVYGGLMHRFYVVSGGPGRGKTAICEIIALAFIEAGRTKSKEDIIMLAPTGRAAQRITESTGYPAMTAQRAVIQAKRGAFPEDKLIIVDESSMADIHLFYNILQFAKNCNLILVGDVKQIPSVGPGKILKDLLDSGVVPSILLEKGHRNSGSIAHNSDLIDKGMSIDRYVYDEHFHYTPCNKENIRKVIVEDYLKKVDEYKIENVMLCVALRDRGPVSVESLNKTLQETITKGADEISFGSSKFRVGDRVMQMKNNYEFFVKRASGNIEVGVFNGERGTVVKAFTDQSGPKLVVKFDDGSIAGYSGNTIGELTLAYATTLHKCQGSEAPCMMMAYTFGDFLLLNRSLFYTGETRAKKEFRFYGEEKKQWGKNQSAFDWAVRKVDDKLRNTYLARRLQSLRKCA